MRRQVKKKKSMMKRKAKNPKKKVQKMLKIMKMWLSKRKNQGLWTNFRKLLKKISMPL